MSTPEERRSSQTVVTRASIPDDAQRRWARDLRIYIVLAGAYFGLYAVLLTLIPSWATRHGSSPPEAGVLLAILAATGFIGDSLVGRASNRFGVRAVIFCGIGMASIGAAVLLVANTYSSFLVAAITLGIALSVMMTPILGGLASHAGDEQIRAQSANAAWQRAGALSAALFLVNVLKSSGDIWVIAALLILISTLLTGTLLLHSPRVKSEVDAQQATVGDRRGLLIPLIRSSRILRTGLIVSVVTPMLIIVGSSFFPLILLAMLRPELLVACLVSRELLAIGFARALRNATSRRFIARAWMVTALIGAAGLAIAPFLESSIAIVALFSLHGAAISAGIILTNVRIYDASVPSNRIHGYAAAAIVARSANLVFPLLLGVTLAISPAAAMGFAAGIVLVAVTVYIILARKTTEKH